MHCEYIRAGATVIEIWNYSVTEHWLRGQKQFATAPAAEIQTIWERLTRQAVRLAKEARRQCAAPHVRIAGALPPLGASFDAEAPIDLLTAEPVDVLGSYTEQARVLADEGCDLFLIETCASIAFASAAVAACRSVSPTKELWLALTLQNDAPMLWSGEPIALAVQCLAALPHALPEAILFNCSPPEVISEALALLRPRFAGRIGGYGNSRGARKKYGAEQANAHGQADGTASYLAQRVDLDPDRYAQWGEDWVRLGGGDAIVGGCCGVGPEHTQTLSEKLGEPARPEVAEEAGEEGGGGWLSLSAATVVRAPSPPPPLPPFPPELPFLSLLLPGFARLGLDRLGFAQAGLSLALVLCRRSMA